MPPKLYTVRQAFNAGEISELVQFRDDVQKYSSACRTLENAMPIVEGGAKKMPGTYFAGTSSLGGSMFTGSITGTVLTVTAVNYGVLKSGQSITGNGVSSGTTILSAHTGRGGVGTYEISAAQTVVSEMMQTATSGKSRLVPFQFSTEQGAFLEFSQGIVRIWEHANTGDWAIGLATDAPNEPDYDPATSYAVGNITLVGPTCFIYLRSGIPGGSLYVSSPYGTTNANTVQITFSLNTTDMLSVTATGSSPNQGINVALANATASLNSASAIEDAIRALVFLNSSTSNFVDLDGWTVTPDPTYFANPWTTVDSSIPHAGTTWFNMNWIVQCTQTNQNDQFPIILSGSGLIVGYNSSYWEEATSYDKFPIEVVTPYLEEDLFDLDCSTQSADILWIFHPKYPPATIQRLSANSWQYSLSLPGQSPGEPPYRGTLGVVKTGYSALGQSITKIEQANPCGVFISSPTIVINEGDRVYLNEIAGMVELNQGEYIARNTLSYPNGTSSFQIEDPDTGILVDSSGFLAYAGGGFAVNVISLFSQSGDYPACGTLYQERLTVGGSNNAPTQLNGSVQDDYPNFICDPNEADYAIQFTLVSNKVNQLVNMIGTPNALLIGTSGGVWVVEARSGASLSQTNVNAALQSSLGVSRLQPQLVNGSGIFVSRSTRIVTFLVYNFGTNSWENNDLTRLNRNITIGPSASQSGISQTAFQMEPYPVFWAVRNDGQLIGLVFNTQDQVYAWFRVKMDGASIESVAVITGANEEDQIAIVVNRTINGVAQRYVEYFMQQEIFGQLSNAFFVNCGQQWSGGEPVAISGIQNSNPCVVESLAHGFSNGTTVQIVSVEGMTQVNQDATQAYTVANATTNTFELQGVDSTAWSVYESGGMVMQVANQVTGVSYLIGNKVVAVGDGAKILPPTLVTSDTVTFPYYCNLITIGLQYNMTVQPTNPVVASQTTTTRGMKQKESRVTLSLYQSMGGKCGTDLEHMYPIVYGTGSELKVPSMSTGEYTRDLDADWTDESTFYITNDDPLPFTLRGLVLRLSYNAD